MYELEVQGSFSAAHKLPGVRVCENLHGHTWKVRVTICSPVLNKNGMVVDFRDIKSAWSKYDHSYLNDKIVMPTAENLAKVIHDEVMALTGGNVKVTVWESPSSSVTYFREQTK